MSPTSDAERPPHPLCASTPLARARTEDNRTDVADNHVDNRVDEMDNVHNDPTDTENHNAVDAVDNIVTTLDNRVGVDTLGSVDTLGVGVDNRVESVDTLVSDDISVGNHVVKRIEKRIDNYDTVNGNVNVNIVSESTTSMDVLSGGESDAGDTLSRRNNNNSIASGVAMMGDATMRRRGDVTYYVAKELLMTERTYKRDLELITVSWSQRVGALGGGAEAGALARGCLALGPLALPAGALLARLERALAAAPARPADTEEPEYKKIADLLYDYLSSTYDALSEYSARAGALVALVESARRRGGAGARAARAFDLAAPLPLACLLLRPLHRAQHLARLAHELWAATGSAAAGAAQALARDAARAAAAQLRHVENHAALCQLQRDVAGYDKLLVAGREFIRLGCVYKHSSKGLQQRMLFLLSDLLLITSKCASGQFRAHCVLPLCKLTLEDSDLPHSFVLTGEDINILMSASNEQEYVGWRESLAAAVALARDRPADVDTELTPVDNDEESSTAGAGGGAGGALSHVCWHRAASLDRHHLHLAMQTQLSGYLLRKFKNSHGWQKLWVVFAAFTLFFYKSWQDETPLASLPLLGYSVGAPAASDGIDKEFVFKLQFKNHVYFFRADSHFTFCRWIEVLQTPMVHHQN